MKINVLISTIGIPSNTIGSWNIMLTNLIINKPNLFQYIVCPKIDIENSEIKYFFAKVPSIGGDRITKYFRNYKYKDYYLQVKKILKNNNKININVIDNVKLLYTIHDLLVKDNLRERVNIIFHLHAMDVIVKDKNYFYSCIDTLFLLTKTSYKYQTNQNHALTCKVKQIYNGINTSVFYPLTKDEIFVQKERIGLNGNKFYYLWLSQDRKKKGLHIILEAWEKFSKTKQDVELLIIGTNYVKEERNVKYLGKIKNDKIAVYYQVSSFYLFPTLWHEGHPLSLTEALMSGCYCIASDIDPIPEVLNYGEYGRLVQFPNDPNSWLNALEESFSEFKNLGNVYKIPSQLYSMEKWMNTMSEFINE